LLIVLDPNDSTDLAGVEDRILAFQDHYEQIATPFQWKFTRADLDVLAAATCRGRIVEGSC